MSTVLHSVFLALFGIYFQVQRYFWEYLIGLCLGILRKFHTNYVFLLFCGLFLDKFESFQNACKDASSSVFL